MRRNGAMVNWVGRKRGRAPAGHICSRTIMRPPELDSDSSCERSRRTRVQLITESGREWDSRSLVNSNSTFPRPVRRGFLPHFNLGPLTSPRSAQIVRRAPFGPNNAFSCRPMLLMHSAAQAQLRPTLRCSSTPWRLFVPLTESSCNSMFLLPQGRMPMQALARVSSSFFLRFRSSELVSTAIPRSFPEWL